MKTSVMKFLKLTIMLSFVLIGFSNAAIGQTKTDTTWIVETKDGNNYVGTVKYLRDSLVEVTTKLGTLTIPKRMIQSISLPKKDEMVKGEYWPENPHSSRHFWGPSGYGLRKGEGYYQNIWVFFNQASYGFTDNFTLGIGVVPLFLFGAGLEYTPFWITPKFNFPYKNGKGAFGAGTILFGITGEEGQFVGILYGTNTFGTRDRQLTLGLGYGYNTGEDGGFAKYPTLSVSGMIRTSRKWAFITENYLIAAGENTNIGFVSGGARFMAKHLAIDFGGFIPVSGELDRIIILPWLGITVPFR